MKLTPKLMGYLYRPFSKDPAAYFALALDSDFPNVSWTVADQILTTEVPTHPLIGFALDLTAYTLQGLVTAINGHAHWTATLQPGVDGSIAAVALLDGSGAPDTQSNGDHLFAYADPAWAYMDAVARELTLARAAITAMLRQLRLDQSEGEWVDFWLRQTPGGLRQDGESDATLIQQIMATVTALKCNNKALEVLVLNQTGIAVTVVDLDWYQGDSSMYTYTGGYWDAGMVTNSASSRIYPAWEIDAGMVAAFDLALGLSGLPCFGDSHNDNPLLDAFAVVFQHLPAPSPTNVAKVMAVIEAARGGGTLGIAYHDGEPIT